MSEMPVLADMETPTLSDALALGLTSAEYELVCEKQGRRPNQVELAMYSLMWSEHCAYKHSKKLLRSLPTEGRHVVMGPGRTPVRSTSGEASPARLRSSPTTIRVRSSPSRVPRQGSAASSGTSSRSAPGRLRCSIRCVREPAADSPAGAHTRYLLDGAVSGIGHYGNSIGVPTVGGEVYFEGPYEQNCLVNAMALGLAPREALVRSAAAGPGNVLVLFGASTGRDGIGGASVLASAELGELSADKRPSVQVGDPFEEKKLLECSIRAARAGSVGLIAGSRRRRAHVLGL